MKVCNKCKETRPLEEFSLHNQMKDGRHPTCKTCRSASRKSYRDSNKEKVNQQKKDSYYRHVDQNRAKARDKWWSDVEGNREKSREYYRNGGVRAKKYGLTQGQLDDLYSRQQRRCAWCGREEDGETIKVLRIDHDHSCCPRQKSCGRCVRRLLCDDCNIVEGHMSKSWPAGLAALEAIAWYNLTKTGIENKEELDE